MDGGQEDQGMLGFIDLSGPELLDALGERLGRWPI
jgi:hypothetical protein